MKIGMLIPHSKTYPSLGKDYMNGMKLGLKGSAQSCSFIVEGIGIGADHKVLIDKAQKMINQDEVQIITGLLGHLGIAELRDFVSSMEVVLMYSDLGATIPFGLTKNPWVFCNSFELYKSAMLVGKNVGKWGHKNLAISTSFYDSGYGMTAALEKTLYEAGGEFAGHFITPLNPRENEAALMKEFVDEVKPDAIFAVHSGIYAKEHAQFLAENEISKDIPFYTSSFAIEGDLLGENQAIYEGVGCVSSWFIEDESEGNLKFIEAHQEEYGKLPSPFSLLGYENGLILKKSLEELKNESLDTHQLKEVLTKAVTMGPRGKIAFVPEINRTSFSHYLWRLIKANGSYTKQKEEVLKDDIELTRSILDEPESNQAGGWFNAYLCN